MMVFKNNNSNRVSKFLNLSFFQKRSMLDLNERRVCWYALSEEDREKYYTIGFTQSYPGPMEEKAMWNDWYVNEFLTKRPKTFFKRWFYIWFIESIVMYFDLYKFPVLKNYVDMSNDPYWELFQEELLMRADDYHVEIYACWQMDNWERQFGMEGLFWIMSFFFWDYVFEEWTFSETFLEDFYNFIKDDCFFAFLSFLKSFF